ncbi:hypothetical protein DFH09DRAFT_1039391 [Mycena vulgaris]|nr:hypothetical protein DFH09DRAFT_1039391 [Mycena vulgaris]
MSSSLPSHGATTGWAAISLLTNNILPALQFAKAGVTGLGVPGVEPIANGVLELAMMVATMQDNQDDLLKLENSLATLITLQVSGPSGDLQDRLARLTINLKVIVAECKVLAEKNPVKRFLKSKAYKDKIQLLRGQIASHIRDFTFYGNISIEKSVQDIAKSVEAIEPKVDNVRANQLLGTLKCVPARYNAEHTPDKCMTGTRVNIITDILQRLTDPSESSQRIVMLSGTAGSGKSTIAKSVASILVEEQETLAASFFFSRDYADRKEIRYVPTTIARQLADHHPQYRYLLVNLLDSDRSGILSAEPHFQFQRLIVDLLGNLPPSQKPWVICLDALDECGSDRGQVFLCWLSESINQIPKHIRFFLTGRPDVPSYLKLDSLCDLMHGIVLDQIDTTLVSHDIHIYIQQSLHGQTWIPKNSWTIQAPDVDRLTHLADGLFVFAATAVRYIRAGVPQTHPQKSITYLLKGAPLTNLHDLYHLIVNEAVPLPSSEDPRAQDAHDCATRVLSTIFQLSEPLNLKALAALLSIDVGDLEGILVPLSSVIRVSPGGPIQIIHLSFREFMMSQAQKRRFDLLCGTEQQKCSLASDLLQVLKHELKFNICHLPTSYLRNGDMPDLTVSLDTYIPGHLRYACRFWVDHLTSTSHNPRNAELASELMMCKFLFWLEVLSLLGMVGYASKALSKLTLWMKV